MKVTNWKSALRLHEGGGSHGAHPEQRLAAAESPKKKPDLRGGGVSLQWLLSGSSWSPSRRTEHQLRACCLVIFCSSSSAEPGRRTHANVCFLSSPDRKRTTVENWNAPLWLARPFNSRRPESSGPWSSASWCSRRPAGASCLPAPPRSRRAPPAHREPCSWRPWRKKQNLVLASLYIYIYTSDYIFLVCLLTRIFYFKSKRLSLASNDVDLKHGRRYIYIQ